MRYKADLRPVSGKFGETLNDSFVEDSEIVEKFNLEITRRTTNP